MERMPEFQLSVTRTPTHKQEIDFFFLVVQLVQPVPATGPHSSFAKSDVCHSAMDVGRG